MTTTATNIGNTDHALRVARVLRVSEDHCEVWAGNGILNVGFAATVPGPWIERISPGHVVALAADADGSELVVWRWYDAVVLSPTSDGAVRPWEPAHGEVVAQCRPTFVKVEPGVRVYASAGLPGADWWAAGPATRLPSPTDIDLPDVRALYADNHLWSRVFPAGSL